MTEPVNALQCGPGCIWSDKPHAAPEIDWIGDAPLAHGESERSDDDGDAYCLCGHPNYLTCPRGYSEGILTWTLSP